jgi:hypothetical protein
MPTGIRGHVTFCLLLPVAPAAQARMQRNGTHSLIPGSPATPTYVTAAASYSGTRRHSALACSAGTKGGNCSLGTADHLPCSCSSCSLVVGLVLRTRVCAVRLHCSVAVVRSRAGAGWAQNKNNSCCILPALQSYSFTTCNRIFTEWPKRSSHQQLVRTARAAEIYYSKAVVLCMIRGEGRRCICKQLAKTP